MDHSTMRRLHGGGHTTGPRAAYDLTLKDKHEIAERTWLYTFEKPEELVYQAGQHVRMELSQLDAKSAGGNVRFLSFASAPHERDISFALRMRDSNFKNALHSLLPGQTVVIEMLKEPPKHAFATRIDDGRSRLFIAGGIGVVPAYSMVKSLLHSNDQAKLTLMAINRRPEDAPFHRDLSELSSDHPAFRFIPVMTKAMDWEGETGRISPDLLRRNVPNLKHTVVYVAGLEDMVSSAVTALRKVGVPKSQIRTEQFGAFSGNTLASRSGHKWARPASMLILGLIAVHIAVAIYVLNSMAFFKALSPGMIGIVTLCAVILLVMKVLAVRKAGARRH